MMKIKVSYPSGNVLHLSEPKEMTAPLRLHNNYSATLDKGDKAIHTLV